MIRTRHKTLLGRINAAYGIKGWVKVFSYTDPLDGILKYSPWILRHQGTESQVEVRALRKHGKGIVTSISEIVNRDEAEALIGSEIWGELPDLDEKDFYWFQLQGLMVLNTSGDVLGKVANLMETGAHDVLVIEPTCASADKKARLIPYVEEIVEEVSLSRRRILVNWLTSY